MMVSLDKENSMANKYEGRLDKSSICRKFAYAGCLIFTDKLKFYTEKVTLPLSLSYNFNTHASCT